MTSRKRVLDSDGHDSDDESEHSDNSEANDGPSDDEHLDEDLGDESIAEDPDNESIDEDENEDENPMADKAVEALLNEFEDATSDQETYQEHLPVMRKRLRQLVASEYLFIRQVRLSAFYRDIKDRVDKYKEEGMSLEESLSKAISDRKGAINEHLPVDASEARKMMGKDDDDDE